MSLKKYFRRNIYKWHRITSLIIAVPVLLWTVSGFLHPVMNLVKPAVKNNFVPAAVIDTAKVKIPLRDALVQNGIERFHNFHLVTLNGELWYQIAQKGVDSLTYISCKSGDLLPNGDRLYATFLAQRYLAEENKESPVQEGHSHHSTMTAGFAGASFVAKEKTVTNAGSRILSTTLLTDFTKDYKRSNKILPVYEVAFDREDGLTLYIETGADRLALASDHNKRWFSSFFSFAHSWSFLDGLGKTKSVLLGTFAALCFLSSVFGFAVYNVLNTKKKKAAAGQRWHHVLGNVFLLTTLLYGFSGAWHAFAKLPSKPAINQLAKADVSAGTLPTALPLSSLPAGKKLTNVSLAVINDQTYWQVMYKNGKEKGNVYVNVSNGATLPEGDTKYAAGLACQLKSTAPSAIQRTQTLTAFNHSYSMMNKRLPVVEVAFRDGEKYYIEPGTGSLAAITRPSDKAERFSFSNLHMHHYWEMWLGKEAGKTVRNTVLISTTLGLLLLAVTGLLIYARKKYQWRK